MMLTHHGAHGKLKLFHLEDGGFNHQRDYKEVLKDITAKINNSNSIFSQSGDKLKFSIPPIKRKLVSTENINNKLLKTHNEENYDSSLDDAIKEYYKIMGEDSSSISL
ncbi:hypothetical protein [Rickettsia endosymbiont of Rhinocyllus conicus]|uniref:hypothetical protein n=1 Tax=Rickettsia endosymbiont of Rhinocyllus conicus TaxID=3066252 RepID=UPI0031334DD6